MSTARNVAAVLIAKAAMQSARDALVAKFGRDTYWEIITQYKDVVRIWSEDNQMTPLEVAYHLSARCKSDGFSDGAKWLFSAVLELYEEQLQREDDRLNEGGDG